MENKINQRIVEKRYGADAISNIDFFRSIAFIIEDNPNHIVQYLDHPSIGSLVKDRSSSCIERTQWLEMLAYGDAGVLLASPGPSLSGLIVRELGNPEQQEIFFNHVATHKARTFLAVTEPNYGSDANMMQTALEKDSHDPDLFRLTGEKWLVGNGVCGSIGVVIARTSPGPLGITAVLLPPVKLLEAANNGKTHIARKLLPTVGLMGAQLSRLTFTDCPIEREYMLGRHLSVVHRGMLAVIKTFNRMRPCVGALALGLAQAILDYIQINRLRLNSYETDVFIRLSLSVDVARQLLHSAAIEVDKNPLSSAAVSLAKMQATYVAEMVARQAFIFFGKGAFFEHPWLAKWYRDCFAFEYMEGTTSIHKKNIFQGYSNGSL